MGTPYVVVVIPATGETWHAAAVADYSAAAIESAVYAAADVLVPGDCDSWWAYAVGEHADAGAASAAWATLRESDPRPIASGVYQYDEDGVAPVSVGVVMLTEGGR